MLVHTVLSIWVCSSLLTVNLATAASQPLSRWPVFLVENAHLAPTGYKLGAVEIQAASREKQPTDDGHGFRTLDDDDFESSTASEDGTEEDAESEEQVSSEDGTGDISSETESGSG